MEYINIGTNRLLEEYFYQVINSDKKFKPAGGLWCTPHYAPSFNEWLDFIIKKPVYYSRYAGHIDPFKIDGVVIELADGSKVFDLGTKESIEELERKYNLDYEKLSMDYDALTVDPYQLNGVNLKNAREYARLFAIKTLTVFNMKVIRDYKKALIEVEPFDYSYGYPYDVFYDTKLSDERFKIEPESEEYKDMLDYIYNDLKDFIFHLRIEHPEFSSNKMAYYIKLELMRVYGEEVIKYAKKKDLDGERLAYSLSIKTLRKVK